MTKKYKITILDKDRNILKSDVSSVVTSDIEFNSQLNGGQGELELSLNMPWDNPESWTDPFNFIQVYVIDSVNPLGRLLYTGWISQRTPILGVSDSQVVITCLGLVSLLSLAHYKNGSSFDVAHSSEDPADIIKAVIDHFQSTYPPSSGSKWIAYDGGHIDDFGSNVTYEFKKLNWASAIQKAVDLSTGFNWYIDQNGQVYFNQKPSSPDHIFTISEHVSELQPPENIEEIINSVTYNYNGGTASPVEDATSISTYGKRDQYVSDNDITDSATATAAAQKIVDENKDPKIQATAVINTRYDFESIQPGQTCKFRDYKIGSAVLSDNMQIVSVSYSPEFCTIELEGLQYDLNTELTKKINE